ncbi:MAG: flagellar biosynthesis protein FlhB [Planctomycetes bacterium]|nr:flagellar biosynthesis protein FlhB [Planctomycetota bacterium]
MAMDEMGEKTEAPTARRLQESRDEGQIARSQDLTAAITLMGAMLLLGTYGEKMLGGMETLVQSMISGSYTSNATRADDIGGLWAMGMQLAMRMVAPVAIGIVVLAIVATVMQVGILVTFRPLMPKFEKLSPLQGFANLFSLRGLMRLAMSVLKVAIVGAVGAWCVYDDLPKLLALIYLDAPSLLAAASWLIWVVAIKLAAVLLILGILDYAYQKWQHMQQLMMSKQEVKEEMRNMEGDPLIKQRRAQVARQLAMQRLQADVPKADVIVTNPTHFSIALQYDGKKMAAPKVVAKGADLMAMRIRQLAVQHGIPIVERPPLARALYKAVKVGDQIPGEYYAAVAEILAYVYRLNGRKSA